MKKLEVQILAYSWYSQSGTFLCIVTTLANLSGLGNSTLDMLGLKICVSAGAIIGAAIFKNLALIWSDPVDLNISN